MSSACESGLFFAKIFVKSIKIESLRTLLLCLVLACLVWWSDGGRNNVDMVNMLRQKGILRTPSVARAMLAIDRKNYCPNVSHPYDDAPQDIGYGATISAPHVHALALELLKDSLSMGESALDVGSGSGYLTVCMAVIIGEPGLAVGIDLVPELVAEATSNVQKHQPWLLSTSRVKFVTGDGRQGYEKQSPYKAIYVGALIPEVPQKLMEQLKIGGRLIAPVGMGHDHFLTVMDKGQDGRVRVTKRMGLMGREQFGNLQLTNLTKL